LIALEKFHDPWYMVEMAKVGLLETQAQYLVTVISSSTDGAASNQSHAGAGMNLSAVFYRFISLPKVTEV